MERGFCCSEIRFDGALILGCLTMTSLVILIQSCECLGSGSGFGGIQTVYINLWVVGQLKGLKVLSNYSLLTTL